MKLIIDIPNRLYEALKERPATHSENLALYEYIVDSTPLNECEAEDCISRQALLDKQYRIDDSATLSTRDVVNVEDIEDAPSVYPKSEKSVAEYVDKLNKKLYNIRKLIENIDYAGEDEYTGEDEWCISDRTYKRLCEELEIK